MKLAIPPKYRHSEVHANDFPKPCVFFVLFFVESFLMGISIACRYSWLAMSFPALSLCGGSHLGRGGALHYHINSYDWQCNIQEEAEVEDPWNKLHTSRGMLALPILRYIFIPLSKNNSEQHLSDITKSNTLRIVLVGTPFSQFTL